MKKFLEHPDIGKTAALTLIETQLQPRQETRTPATLLKVWEQWQTEYEALKFGLILERERLLYIWVRVRCEASRRTICLQLLPPLKPFGLGFDWMTPWRGRRGKNRSYELLWKPYVHEESTRWFVSESETS